MLMSKDRFAFRMSFRIIGLVALLGVAMPAAALVSFSPAKSMTPAEVRADLSVLRQAIDEGHAGLDRQGGRLDYERLVRSLVEDPPSEVNSFLWRLAEAVAAIRDGHTRVHWPKDLLAQRASKSVWIPARFTIVDERLWIAEAKASNLAGLEVLAIDGRPWPNLRSLLHRVTSADAGLPQAKDWLLSEDGELTFLLGEHFGYLESHRLLLRDSSTFVPFEITLDSAPWSEVPKAESATENPWLFSVDDGIGYLRIKHFVPYFYEREDLDFSSLLATTLSRLNDEADRLIIDVRGNRGGSEDWVRDLLSYLLQRPFGYYRSAELKRQTFPYLSRLRPDSDFPGPEELVPGPAGGWMLPESIACQSRYDPEESGFSGRVVLLTDGGTFSAAAELASILKSERRAILVGDSPGGAYSGNTSGLVVSIELPASGARVRVPLAALWLAVEQQESEAIAMDHSILDKRNGRDLALEFAQQLLR